jgi:hypothetical protein
MLIEILKYIRSIRRRVKDLVPESELDLIMNDVSDLVLRNWVDEKDYKITRTQIMELVRKHIAKKYRIN